jgi:hypothetical protein
MILTALLLPFAMLGMVFTLAWIEERYLTINGQPTPRTVPTADVVTPLRAEPRVVVRRRPGRHRAPAGFLASHGPPGRRMNPRRV